MAIAITLPGQVKDLGRSVTPFLLLMDRFFYRFSRFSGKINKIYYLKIEFLQNAPSNSGFFFQALHLSVRRFQMLVEGLSSVKTLVKVWN